MNKKLTILQQQQNLLEHQEECLQSIELQEDIDKAQLAIASSILKQTRNQKRVAKKDIKETIEVIDSLEK